MVLKFIILAGLLFVSNSVLAMKVLCNSVATNFERADVVFVGKVVTRRPAEQTKQKSLCWTQENGPRCGPKMVTVDVDRAIKGEIGETVTVSAGDACYCVDPYLQEGNRYIIFAKLHDGESDYASMNSCATQPYSKEYLSTLPAR